MGDAENGQDALEKIEQLEPDVIMTDIRMPYMDGLELIAKIRQKYPSMKVLIFPDTMISSMHSRRSS